MRGTTALVITLGLALCFPGWARRPRASGGHSRQRSAPTPAPAPLPPTRSVPGPRPVSAARAAEGRVTDLGASGAFLDRGARDGLARGASVTLLRRGATAAHCTVQELSDHHATCAGAGARVGDTFQLGSPPRGVSAPPLPPSPAELEPLRARLAAAPFSPVEFHGTGAGSIAGSVRRVWADFTFAQWDSSASPDGTFQQERVDLAARGVPLALGLSLDLDAQAVHWSRRPATFRFPDSAASRLWVYQAEISRRQVGQAIAFAAGRLWPWNAPGVGALDGVQFGVQTPDGTLELGALAGTLADPVTLAPTLDRPLGGIYAALARVDRDGPVRFVQNAVRFTIGSTPEAGLRFALEDELRAELGPAVSLAAGLRLGHGATDAPALVELGRLDLQLRATERLRLSAGARYVSDPLTVVPALDGGLAGVRGLHTDLSASWDVTSVLTLGLVGGYLRDLQTRQTRGYLGPELSLPRLFGVGGLALGYLEEPGTTASRSAYAQVTAGGPGLAVFARASWFSDQLDPLAPTSDGGLSATVQWAPLRWLWVRGSLIGRARLWDGEAEAEEGPRNTPIGLTASASVGAAL